MNSTSKKNKRVIDKCLENINSNIKIIREHGGDAVFRFIETPRKRSSLKGLINCDLLAKFRDQIDCNAHKVPWKTIWDENDKRLHVSGWPSEVVGKDISDLLKNDLGRIITVGCTASL